MATKIEWCDDTANILEPVSHNGKPVKGGWGCTKIASGCRNCYAERMNRWMGNGESFTGHWEFELKQKVLDAIMKRKKPTRYFVQQMGDWCHEDVNVDILSQLFYFMGRADRHTFMLLTKRPERMRWYLRFLGAILDESREIRRNVPPWPFPNLWLGVSVSTQEDAEKNIPLLCECPAKVRFVSYEPALGPIDWSRLHTSWKGIHWVIVGGESGPQARQCNMHWLMDTVQECRDAGVKVFVKQVGTRPTFKHPKGGDPGEWPEGLRVREVPQ